MFASLRSRLWLTYALITALVLCVVAAGLLVYLLRNPLVDRLAYLNLERIAETLVQRSEALESLLNRPEDIATRIDSIADIRVLVLTIDHSTLVDSRQGSSVGFGPLALRSIRLPRGLARDQSGQTWIYVTRELPNGNTLVLATPRRGGLSLFLVQRFRDILREDIFPPFLTAGFLALILALLLALWMARWVAAPLQRMAIAARRLAEGHYQPIEPEGPEEVQELARDYNEMTNRVQASQQSQREFVANVSHELKTPLTSIQGFAQAIMDGTASKVEDIQQAAGIIYAEAGKMHDLVLDLLDLARFDAGTISMERDPVDLLELLRGLVARFEPQARQAQVDLRLQSDALPILFGDADRLAQVFGNLVDNALKYTPPGGTVTLTTRRAGEQVEVLVGDTGLGISPEELTRIFERFYQTDKSRRGGRGRGVGLGLAIAREIVHAHGGDITVKYNTPQGSLFVVKLPIGHPEDSPSPQVKPGLEHAARNDHRPMLQ